MLSTALRFIALGCIALFIAAIYLHSQPALLTSVLLGIAVAIVKLRSVAKVDPMELRDKLRARAEPYLEPGETFQVGFTALSGPGPYLVLIAVIFGVLLSLLTGRRYVRPFIRNAQWTVVVTDRAILLLKSSGREEEFIVTRLPRDTRLGPVSGWWAMISLNGEWMFVHRRFHADVELADKAIAHREIVERPDQVLHWRRGRKRVSLRSRGHGRDL
jgi:hypothetical protein